MKHGALMTVVRDELRSKEEPQLPLRNVDSPIPPAANSTAATPYARTPSHALRLLHALLALLQHCVERQPILSTPVERRYTLQHGPLPLPSDTLRYLHLDLRRVARPGLQEAVHQEHLC